MNPFRKSKRESYVSPGSLTVNDTVVMSSKEIASKDSPEPTTYVEAKIMSVPEYAKSLGMPKDEDYQLRDMLKAGQIPQEVPVRGMLDSQDPLDLSNAGVGDAIFDELSAQVKSLEPAPAPAEPAPSVEPSNE